jgi:acyl carrier protein
MLKNCQSTVMEIIEIALELKPGVLKENSSSEKMDEWDSLGQLSILVALDKYFKGQISGISEMAEADSVQKILTILKGKSLC